MKWDGNEKKSQVRIEKEKVGLQVFIQNERGRIENGEHLEESDCVNRISLMFESRARVSLIQHKFKLQILDEGEYKQDSYVALTNLVRIELVLD